MAVLLSVQDLSLDYSSSRKSTVPILRNVSLAIERGEAVGLLGPSGSGKTSLLRCILGINGPTAAMRCGELRFEGRDLLTLSARERRILRFRHVGFIAQDPVSRFSPFRRVGAQIKDTSPPRARFADLPDLLRGAGFSDPERIARSWPHELSGGEAQRVAIAQALAGQPSLLLADEPTSALDTIAQRQVLNLLLRLRVQGRTAMLIVSYDPALLGSVADRILVLHNGVLADHRPCRRQRPPRKPVPAATASPLIELRGIRFAYGRHQLWPRAPHHSPILHDICLSVAPGESLAIVGASGSGKSTLARCIAGVESRYRGEIIFGGRAIGNPRRLSTRAEIQLILQDTVGALNPRLTVAEILAEPLLIHSRRDQSIHFTHQSISDRMLRTLRAVSLPPAYLRRHPPHLSGGERQRVAIARALMLAPSLLLLDEALTGLDRGLQDSILAMLDSLRMQMNLACVHFTHDLARFLHSADRIAVLHQGHIVECHAAGEFPRLATHPTSLQLLQAMLPDPCAS